MIPDDLETDDRDVVDAIRNRDTAAELALRRPDVPINLAQLAALKGEAVEVIQARVQIIETLWRASIRLTSPEDWVLFKAREEDGGQIVAYCEDAGCERFRKLWGIEIVNVGTPEKIVGHDPTDFLYVITGDGRCSITGERVERMEGARSSKDDYAKDATGAALDRKVRVAARANLDGGIVRELAGMKSVPVQELEAAWIGTSKSIDRCRRGRGFGTRDARLGGDVAADVDLVPPPCPVCRKPMALRKGSKGFFYSCPDYKAHGRDARTVDLEDWRQNPASKKPAPPPPAPTGRDTGTEIRNGGRAPDRVDRDLRADEVFRGTRDREPGEEG